MKYKAKLVSGDFSKNTMTFEIEGEMILQAGEYQIIQISEGNALPINQKTEVTQWVNSLKIQPSTRLYNTLKSFKYMEDITRYDFLKVRNAGISTWDEFQKLIKDNE